MTKTGLLKLIDDEVSKMVTEPIREPLKELPKSISKPINPALRDEDEIDEYLFKAGMKEK